MKYILSIFLTCWVVILAAQTQLKLQGGTNIKVTSDIDIVLYNTSFINNGTFTANNGEVHLTGDGTNSQSTVGGTSTSTFHDLTINKSVNDASLENHITILNSINLTNGYLGLNDFDLTLEGSYTIQNGYYFKTSGIGNLKREVANGETKIFPIGNETYTPMTIQNEGITDIFAVRTTPEVLENGNSGNAYTNDIVGRTWFIEEAVAGGSDLTLTPTWNAADELAGFDRTQCYISHYTGSGWNGTTPGAAVGSDPYSISQSGITSLSPFAVGSSGALPIELLDFYAFRDGENVKLEWTTATEINSDVFEIEHSMDDISFKKIGVIQAATFSDQEIDYTYFHKNPVDGINYYRLKMWDLDGSFEYSEIRSVDILDSENPENFFVIYPNPTSDILNIQFEKNIEEVSINIINELGQRVLVSDLNRPSKHTIYVSDFPSGVYFVSLEIDGNHHKKRILIQK